MKILLCLLPFLFFTNIIFAQQSSDSDEANAARWIITEANFNRLRMALNNAQRAVQTAQNTLEARNNELSEIILKFFEKYIDKYMNIIYS